MLGREARGTASSGAYWHIFGGKKDDTDKGSPYATAIRELQEECLNVLSPIDTELRLALVEEATPKFWEKEGSYVLFFVEIPFDESLPQKFDQLKAQNLEDRKCKHLSIRWLRASVISKCAGDPNAFFYQRDCMGPQRLYRYCSLLMSREPVKSLLQKLQGVASTGTAANVCLVVSERQ